MRCREELPPIWQARSESLGNSDINCDVLNSIFKIQNSISSIFVIPECLCKQWSRRVWLKKGSNPACCSLTKPCWTRSPSVRQLIFLGGFNQPGLPFWSLPRKQELVTRMQRTRSRRRDRTWLHTHTHSQQLSLPTALVVIFKCSLRTYVALSCFELYESLRKAFFQHPNKYQQHGLLYWCIGISCQHLQALFGPIYKEYNTNEAYRGLAWYMRRPLCHITSSPPKNASGPSVKWKTCNYQIEDHLLHQFCWFQELLLELTNDTI